jgi:transcriptional regulator with XRE-family HTH domain
MSTTDASVFGRWLKRRRQSLNLTQDALAERAGCAPSMLQKIEQGRRRPSRDLAERLADILGISPEERAKLLQLVYTPMPALAPHGSLESAPGAPIQNDLSPSAGPALPILLTKILPPPTRQLVARPRVLRQLEIEPGGVTLVVAPAGWGKTTLIATWLESPLARAQHVAWVSLDEGDADVALALRYIIAALQRVLPALGGGAMQLLATPQPSVEAVLALLINDIITAGAPVLLVLDDYHRVRAPAIHRALGYLVEHLPPNMHLAIATREDPPLPLARLRARRQ